MPIDLVALAAAWVAGLLGSAHCAAMCGGIATAFGTSGGGWRRAVEPNLGRVLGYALAGAVAGGTGHGIVAFAASDAVATGARVLGGLVLVVVALRILDRRGRFALLARPGARLWTRLRPLQRRLLPADSTAKRIALGMLWGWMPCGLSATVLAAAWLQADARNGALTMLAFGAGTLPLLLPLTWSGARVLQALQRRGWRGALGGVVLAGGVVTMAAPFLAGVPGVHDALRMLGCIG